MLKGALESCCCRESLGSGEPAVFMQWFVIDDNPGDSQGRMWFSEGDHWMLLLSVEHWPRGSSCFLYIG